MARNRRPLKPLGLALLALVIFVGLLLAVLLGAASLVEEHEFMVAMPVAFDLLVKLIGATVVLDGLFWMAMHVRRRRPSREIVPLAVFVLAGVLLITAHWGVALALALLTGTWFAVDRLAPRSDRPAPTDSQTRTDPS